MNQLPRALAMAPLLLALFLLQDLVRTPLLDAARIWAYPEAASYSCPVSTLLVMGAAQYDGIPSPAFRRRLDLALELYREGCGRRIVVSGGRRPGDRFSEGEAGVAYLVRNGVPPEHLAAETAAATTYQNVRNSIPLLADGRLLIVTDDMHAFRSRWVAAHLGIGAEVAAVATSADRFGYAGRELLGLLAYQSGFLN